MPALGPAFLCLEKNFDDSYLENEQILVMVQFSRDISMRKIFVLLALLLLSGCQTGPVKNSAMLESPLIFKASESTKGLASNTLYFPESTTSEVKFPTVILMHSCAGITPKNRGDLERWKSLLMDNGYAVLVMNHLSSRGVSVNCGRFKSLGQGRLVRDVYDATDFLSKQTRVDATRIFTLGFSLGAMTGSSAASRSQYSYNGSGKTRPRAVAGLYGGCVYGGAIYWLDTDIDLPVLWLMGGKDQEAPANDCQNVFKRLRNKDLMKSHLYPDATHCWDCMDLDGFSKKAGNGNNVTYRYNGEYTRDSERRVIEFFSSFK